MFPSLNNEYIKLSSTLVTNNRRLQKYFSPNSHEEEKVSKECNKIAGMSHEIYLFPQESHPNGGLALSTLSKQLVVILEIASTLDNHLLNKQISELNYCIVSCAYRSFGKVEGPRYFSISLLPLLKLSDILQCISGLGYLNGGFPNFFFFSLF